MTKHAQEKLSATLTMLGDHLLYSAHKSYRVSEISNKAGLVELETDLNSEMSNQVTCSIFSPQEIFVVVLFFFQINVLSKTGRFSGLPAESNEFVNKGSKIWYEFILEEA